MTIKIQIFPPERNYWTIIVFMAGISKEGRKELSLLLRPGQTLLRVADVSKQLDIDGPAAGKRLARWAEQGWLRRVRHNLYIPVPTEASDPKNWTADPLYLASAVWNPCYFTGWTTANHWGLTEQMFRTTVVKTTQRVRSNRASLAGNSYLLIHTSNESMSWGMKHEWKDGCRNSLADPARTVIDILASPKIGGGMRLASEIVDTYLSEQPDEALIAYADKFTNAAIFKRLGYLVSTLHPEKLDLIANCREKISGGFSLLDPNAPPTGERSKEWGLVVNVNIEQAEAS